MNEFKTLKIAYFLLTSRNPRTTQEIVDFAECDRKTVYRAIDKIEDSGFVTLKVKERRKPNKYLVRITEDT